MYTLAQFGSVEFIRLTSASAMNLFCTALSSGGDPLPTIRVLPSRSDGTIVSLEARGSSDLTKAYIGLGWISSNLTSLRCATSPSLTNTATGT